MVVGLANEVHGANISTSGAKNFSGIAVPHFKMDGVRLTAVNHALSAENKKVHE
jgi:hypothetical protein